MSQQDIIAVRLALSALFLTFLIIASLLMNVASPSQSFSIPQQHNDDNSHENGMLDILAEMAMKSFSASWAYYSPYYPAAPYEGSPRKGCIISQANIVSRESHPYHTLFDADVII